MKTAIYIEDGVVQLVVTPESEFERNALTSFENKDLDAKIFVGSFYDCRGGWTQQTEVYPAGLGRDIRDIRDKSIIIRVESKG